MTTEKNYEELIELVKKQLPQLEVEAISRVIAENRELSQQLAKSAERALLLQDQICAMQDQANAKAKTIQELNAQVATLNAITKSYQDREAAIRNGEIELAVNKALLVRADEEIKRDHSIAMSVFRNAEIRREAFKDVVCRSETPNVHYNNGRQEAVGINKSEYPTRLVEGESETQT